MFYCLICQSVTQRQAARVFRSGRRLYKGNKYPVGICNQHKPLQTQIYSEDHKIEQKFYIY